MFKCGDYVKAKYHGYYSVTTPDVICMVIEGMVGNDCELMRVQVIDPENDYYLVDFVVESNNFQFAKLFVKEEQEAMLQLLEEEI